jgi:hypothetical protein
MAYRRIKVNKKKSDLGLVPEFRVINCHDASPHQRTSACIDVSQSANFREAQWVSATDAPLGILNAFAH